MMDDLIALAGDLVFERKRLSESLRRLEEALLRAEASRGIFDAIGAQSAEGLHAELDLLARGLDRIGALTKTLVHQVNHDRLIDCGSILSAAAKAVEAAGERLGRPVVAEVRSNEVRIDRRTADQFRCVFIEMLETLIEYGVEQPKERAARKKRPRARCQIEIKPTEGGYRLMVVCDGNGLLPPLIHDHGHRLAELGVRANFEGKPGQWSAWVFQLPMGLGAFKGVYVRAGGRRLCVPAMCVRTVSGSRSAAWRIDEQINRVEGAAQDDAHGSHRTPVRLAVSAGTHSLDYVFDQVTGPEEVFMKPLEPEFSSAGKFLGVVAVEDGAGQSELCLVLNPAYLVYGGEALLFSKGGGHAL